MKTFLKVVAECKRDLQDPHQATQSFITSCGSYKEALFTHVDNMLSITIECNDLFDHLNMNADELDLPY